jgi:phenylalanyl-tRNA synthetase beta chain
MKISLEWLKEYIDLKGKEPEEISSKLSLSGTEVSEIIYPWDYIDNVVVGKIIQIDDHPNAERMVVCKVDVGIGIIQIVTADTSVEEGDVIPTILPGGNINDVKMKKKKLRGVESNGMFISLAEFGLEDESSGVYRYEEEFPIGVDAKVTLGINDAVLDIEVTANRGDCLSILGISRELSAIYDKKVEMKIRGVEWGNKDEFSIKIEDSGCYRYTALIMENVQIKDSPIWLKRRLIASGLRPINNVVDITNYVLLLTGHPIHAFDLSLLNSNEIVVRHAKKDEKMILLDESEIDLIEEDLLITNGKEPVALAGIMGGLNSGIKDDTKTILLEVACFDPIRVRKTCRRLGISSDSSYRFERGVDTANNEDVMSLLVSLMNELSGAVPRSILYDEGKPKDVVEVHLRKWFVDQILGIVVPIAEIERILKSLGFKIKEKGDGWDVIAPSYRFDIEQEIDLVEEIGRIYGYDKVPNELPRILPQANGEPKEFKDSFKIRRMMSAHSYNEIVTYGFMNPEIIKAIQSQYNEQISVLNPLSNELSVMRPSLIYGVLDSVAYNFKRQNKDVKLFEIGHTFNKIGSRYNETEKLCFATTGKINEYDYSDKRNENFYSIKGVIEDIFKYLSLEPEYINSNKGFLEKRSSANIIISDEEVGYFGLFDEEITKDKYNLKNCEIYIAELNLGRLLNKKKPKVIKPEISQFPRVFRDFSLLMNKNLTFEKMKKEILSCGIKDLADISVIDIYNGKGISEGYYSLTIRFTFESMKKTLTEKAINKNMERIRNAITGLDVQLRE